MGNIKQIIFLAIVIALMIMAASCRKSNTILQPKLTPQPGAMDSSSVWVDCVDSTLSYSIEDDGYGGAIITFSYKIDSPDTGSISIQYYINKNGDSAVFVSDNIYPSFLLVDVPGGTDGYIMEYRNIPSMGTWRCITERN